MSGLFRSNRPSIGFRRWGSGTSSAPPVLTANPSISGSPQIGQILTATHGTYTGTITGYNQQWYSNNIAISGATGLIYTVLASDQANNITYQESAYNSGGTSVIGTSNAIGPITPASPVLTGNPSISGTAQVGQTLTAVHGTYGGTVTGYNQQWYSGGSIITGATGLTYVLQNSDVSNNITYRESAFNTGGSSATGTSNALGPVVPLAPVLTANPIISGTAQAGQVLTATHGSYTGTVTGYNGQWFSGTTLIIGATSLTYTLQNSDVGNNITYRESASNAGGNSATGTSNAIGPVAASGGSAPTWLGMNLTGPTYYDLDKPLAEYWSTGQYEYQDNTSSWHPLGDAPNGSATTGDINTHDGWPTTAPSLGPDGVHYTFRKVIGFPPTGAPVTLNVTWSGNAYNISVGNGGSGWTSTGANSGHFSFNQDMTTPRASMQGASFIWSILPGDSTPAKNFSIKAPGAGLLEPIFVSNMANMGIKLLRFMKHTNAEGNYNIWPGAGYSTPYPPAQVTAATRNTLTGGDYGHVGGNPMSGNDGMPIELQLQVAAGVGADVWTSINWNGSTDYYQAIANAIVAHIGASQNVYMEVSNEVWNGGYIVWDQANREGMSKSIGTTISSISHSGTTATVTCAGNHNLVSGDQYTCTLPTPYDYNCLGAAVTIINATQFSYTMPNAISLTSATPSTTGGTLASGTYYYKVAAIVYGIETLASNEVSAVVTGPTGSVVLSWASYPSAQSYKIYRGTAAGSESVYYNPSGTATTFTDTGATATSGTPMTGNATAFGTYGKCMRWPSSFSVSTTLTPNAVVGSGSAAILRLAERSAEIFTIMEPIFQTAGIMSRIKRCLMLQQVAPTNYVPGYMDYVMPDTSKVSAHIDIIGCSSYFDPHAHGYGDTYQPVGDLSDVGPCITASYLGADDTISNCLAYKNMAAQYSKGFGAYEGYYGLTISNGGSPTTAQINFVDAVIADSRFVNLGMYFLQQWQQHIGNCPNMLFCDAQYASNGAQWGILQYMSQSIASQPKALAIQNFAQGKVSIATTLNYSAQSCYLNSSNGDVLGSAPSNGTTGSVFSISTNYNTSALAINSSTGQLSINDITKISVTGTFSVVVTETNSAGINSPQSTTVSFTVLPAILKDNFSGASMDSTKWSQGNGLIGSSGVTTTGVTVSQSTGALVVTTASTASASGYQSVNAYDITQLTNTFVKITAGVKYNILAFGTPGGTVIHVNIRDGSIHLETRDGGSGYSQLASSGSYDSTAQAWLRLRYDPTHSNFYVDTASASGNNPPQSADWTQLLGPAAKPAALATTANFGLLSWNPFGGTGTTTFDGFNTGT